MLKFPKLAFEILNLMGCLNLKCQKNSFKTSKLHLSLIIFKLTLLPLSIVVSWTNFSNNRKYFKKKLIINQINLSSNATASEIIQSYYTINLVLFFMLSIIIQAVNHNESLKLFNRIQKFHLSDKNLRILHKNCNINFYLVLMRHGLMTLLVFLSSMNPNSVLSYFLVFFFSYPQMIANIFLLFCKFLENFFVAALHEIKENLKNLFECENQKSDDLEIIAHNFKEVSSMIDKCNKLLRLQFSMGITEITVMITFNVS